MDFFCRSIQLVAVSPEACAGVGYSIQLVAGSPEAHAGDFYSRIILIDLVGRKKKKRFIIMIVPSYYHSYGTCVFHEWLVSLRTLGGSAGDQPVVQC